MISTLRSWYQGCIWVEWPVRTGFLISPGQRRPRCCQTSDKTNSPRADGGDSLSWTGLLYVLTWTLVHPVGCRTHKYKCPIFCRGVTIRQVGQGNCPHLFRPYLQRITNTVEFTGRLTRGFVIVIKIPQKQWLLNTGMTS